MTYAYLVAFGGLIILIAWLPLFLQRTPLTLAIICVAIGAIFGTTRPLSHFAIFGDTRLAEDLAEATVVIALLGSGLSIDRPFSIRGWRTTWHLLGIAMPLTIGGVALFAYFWGNWSIPAALLLGAVLSPTDPVLASAVAVGPPGRGEDGEVRFALTAEAALNDGLAFPFVSLAVLLASAHAGPSASWLATAFLVKVGAGVAFGWIMGSFFGWLVFKIPKRRLSDTGDGIVAIGLAIVTFASAEWLGINGFLGVFTMALGLRASCPEADFHFRMASFSAQLERLAAMLLLTAFGASVGLGLLSGLRWADCALVAFLLLVLRLTGWFSLAGLPHSALSRGLTAFFGMRGIGTLYYLLYALRRTSFAHAHELAATVGLAVLCSVVLHGTTSTSLMELADAARRRRQSANAE
jgi:NhaP-type Na+/H+ or K+/H+ antiporter